MMQIRLRRLVRIIFAASVVIMGLYFCCLAGYLAKGGG